MRVMSRPRTNCMMSRSCVARSIATPASWMRSGIGPTRVACTRKTWPMRPSAMSSASLPTAGLKRSTWPTMSLTPALRAAAADALARDRLVGLGHADDLGAVDALPRLEVVGPHPAQADDADGQIAHA